MNILLQSFSIKDLASGNYNLVIEVISSKNEILKTKKLYFQRSNPVADISYKEALIKKYPSSFVAYFTNTDTLSDYIASLYPISNHVEKRHENNQLRSKNLSEMQKFFYSFWLKRNELEPEKAWKKYKVQVDFVNEKYKSTLKKGYETDRGRVFLQYGAPNSISESKHEPSAYPYEIWHFYKLKKQTNKRFVFYNTALVGNDYTLLHSDAIGEYNNPNWEVLLHDRNDHTLDMQRKQTNSHFGNEAQRNFED